jgi:sodium bile acid symporter family protein
MSWRILPAAGLAWIGRQGTRAVAFSLFAGLALPPLAALMKAVFTPNLFLLLCLAFLRVAPRELRRHFARPGLVVAALGWTMVAVPLAAGLVLSTFRVDIAPGLFIALIFQAAAPPIISSPSLAALMGLDAALALSVFIVCTAVTPLTAAVFAALFLGPPVEISALALGIKLLALLAGAALVAQLVRRAAGQAWIDRQTERIDGLSVISLFAFAAAVMDGVARETIAHPLVVLGLIALAFATSLGVGAMTALAFARAGRTAALTLAVSAGLRNMGVMVAATGGLVPELTWLYIGMAQFPVYLLPHLLKSTLARADEKRGSATRSS